MITTAESTELTMPSRERLQSLIDMCPHPMEIFWFVLSLLLFMIMGPFAAPIALVAVFTVKAPEGTMIEPESID